MPANAGGRRVGLVCLLVELYESGELKPRGN